MFVNFGFILFLYITITWNQVVFPDQLSPHGLLPTKPIYKSRTTYVSGFFEQLHAISKIIISLLYILDTTRTNSLNYNRINLNVRQFTI